MIPFQLTDKTKPILKMDTISLWLKVVVACIPGSIVTILFDENFEAHFKTPIVIAIALIVYGIAFIVIENWNKKRIPKIETVSDITYKTLVLAQQLLEHYLLEYQELLWLSLLFF